MEEEEDEGKKRGKGVKGAIEGGRVWDGSGGGGGEAAGGI